MTSARAGKKNLRLFEPAQTVSAMMRIVGFFSGAPRKTDLHMATRPKRIRCGEWERGGGNTAPRTFGSALGAMRLHRNVRVQVVECSICLLAAVPTALVHALNLLVASARALVLLSARNGNKGVDLRREKELAYLAVLSYPCMMSRELGISGSRERTSRDSPNASLLDPAAISIHEAEADKNCSSRSA